MTGLANTKCQTIQEVFRKRRREAVELSRSLNVKLKSLRRNINREASNISMLEIVELLEDAHKLADVIIMRMEINPPGPRHD